MWAGSISDSGQRSSSEICRILRNHYGRYWRAKMRLVLSSTYPGRILPFLPVLISEAQSRCTKPGPHLLNTSKSLRKPTCKATTWTGPSYIKDAPPGGFPCLPIHSLVYATGSRAALCPRQAPLANIPCWGVCCRTSVEATQSFSPVKYLWIAGLWRITVWQPNPFCRRLPVWKWPYPRRRRPIFPLHCGLHQCAGCSNWKLQPHARYDSRSRRKDRGTYSNCGLQTSACPTREAPFLPRLSSPLLRPLIWPRLPISVLTRSVAMRSMLLSIGRAFNMVHPSAPSSRLPSVRSKL